MATGLLSFGSLPGTYVGPADILAAAGTPAVAAQSTARKMLAAYGGAAFQITRNIDGHFLEVGFLANGAVDVPSINTFCSGAVCSFTIIYDQINHANDLPRVTGGSYGDCSFVIDPLSNGKNVVRTSNTCGFINRTCSISLPLGAAPITVYDIVSTAEALLSPGNFCCGAYGVVETNGNYNDVGGMFSLAFSTGADGIFGDGVGPWPGIDFEGGVYLYGPTIVAGTPPALVTIAKSDGVTGGSLKDGSAMAGSLTTLVTFTFPLTGPGSHSNVTALDLQRGIALGTGGDGSSAPIYFYEGAIVAAQTTDATDNLLQANIVAFYGP